MSQHSKPGTPFQIDLRRLNKSVGFVALSLPIVALMTSQWLGNCDYVSLSHYYYYRFSGDMFVAALGAIGFLLLFAYTGLEQSEHESAHWKMDRWLIRVAGLCAILVALFPTRGSGCDYAGQVGRAFVVQSSGSEDFFPGDAALFSNSSFDAVAGFHLMATFDDGAWAWIGDIHYGAAGVMFGILAYFSAFVFTRIHSQDALTSHGKAFSKNKKIRNLLYRIFAAMIVIPTATIVWVSFAIDPFDPFFQTWIDARGTFWCETIALAAFGASWLLKGRFYGILSDA